MLQELRYEDLLAWVALEEVMMNPEILTIVACEVQNLGGQPLLHLRLPKAGLNECRETLSGWLCSFVDTDLPPLKHAIEMVVDVWE
jgi:hypothetical protein